MQQYSSRDEKWVSYVVIMFVYSLAVITDWLSALIFICILLEFSGLLPRLLMFMTI